MSTDTRWQNFLLFRILLVQSMVVPVLGGLRLSLSMLDAGSPVRVDCKFVSEAADEGHSERQQQRIPEKFCIGGQSRQVQLIDEKGSRSGSSSARDPGELLHRQTEKGSFGSSTAEDPEEDLHRPRVGQDHFIDEKGSRSGSLSAGDPGELLHRQTEEGRSSTSSPGSTAKQERSEIGRTQRRETRKVGNRAYSKARIANDSKSDELKGAIHTVGNTSTMAVTCHTVEIQVRWLEPAARIIYTLVVAVKVYVNGINGTSVTVAGTCDTVGNTSTVAGVCHAG